MKKLHNILLSIFTIISASSLISSEARLALSGDDDLFDKPSSILPDDYDDYQDEKVIAEGMLNPNATGVVQAMQEEELKRKAMQEEELKRKAMREEDKIDEDGYVVVGDSVKTQSLAPETEHPAQMAISQHSDEGQLHHELVAAVPANLSAEQPAMHMMPEIAHAPELDSDHATNMHVAEHLAQAEQTALRMEHAPEQTQINMPAAAVHEEQKSTVGLSVHEESAPAHIIPVHEESAHVAPVVTEKPMAPTTETKTVVVKVYPVLQTIQSAFHSVQRAAQDMFVYLYNMAFSKKK